MSGSSRKTLPNFRERSRGHPGCPGVVGRTSRISGSFWEALSKVCDPLPDVRE